jgi:tRNA modification GTPase
MNYVHNLEDTICALSTPPGKGGIAVIRVSGPQSLAIARKLCPSLPQQVKTHSIYYAHLKDPATDDNVDEVLVSYFEKGKSFTGQETIEISCHGGPMVSSEIIRLLNFYGARAAERGEFTFRSYMNGKVDLVQAEAILDLIESSSKAAARVASRQLKGELSQKYTEIEGELLWLLAQLEAQIDFSTEDIQPIQPDQLLTRLSSLTKIVDSLLTTYSQGRILKEGLQIVLCGEPNVGKSSLFNRILGEDRAIVTEIQGTTRDVLEGRFQWEGYPVVIKDTAGLHTSDDPVEKLGIQRAQVAMQEADWIFMVIHGPDQLSSQKKLPLEVTDNVFVLVNQIDKLSDFERDQVLSILKSMNLPMDRVHLVSAQTGQGISETLSNLFSRVDLGASLGEEVYINLRHFESLTKVRERLSSAQVLLPQDSPELVAFELQDALRQVHGILGKEFYEQVVDAVFQQFCLGK